MNAPTEVREAVKGDFKFLFPNLNEDDITKLLNIDYSLDSVKEKKHNYKAILAIGCYGARWGYLSSKTKTEQLYKEFIDSSIPIIQEYLSEIEADKRIVNEAHDTLGLSMRFALGWLYQDPINKTLYLRRMRMTQLRDSVDNISLEFLVKVLALNIVVNNISSPDKFRILLDLITELFLFQKERHLVKRANLALIRFITEEWIIHLSKEDDLEKQRNSPNWDWVEMLTNIFEIMGRVSEIDDTDTLIHRPDECEVGGAHYFAWLFGEVAGKIAVLPRWHDALDRIVGEYFVKHIQELDGYTFSRGFDQAWHAVNCLRSLLFEYDVKRDREYYKNLRNRYLEWWDYYSHQVEANFGAGSPLEDIPSDIESYLAMRIGFLDGVLGKFKNGPKGGRPILDEVKEFVDNIEYKSAIEKLFPDTTRDKEVGAIISKRLGFKIEDLPGKIGPKLIAGTTRSAKKEYDGAIWDLHAAVHQSLIIYLLDELDRRFLSHPENQKEYHNRPSALSLHEWGCIFQANTSKISFHKYTLNSKVFQEYCRERKVDSSTIRDLGARLQDVQTRRNEAKSSPTRTQEDQETDFQEVDNLVLGTGSKKSLIIEIKEIFGNSNSRL